MRTFASRAYRRPATPEEVDDLLRLVTLVRGEGDSWEEGIATALQAILISPHFLFRIEQDPIAVTGTTSAPVSENELAARLSYFLWSSTPDDELLQLAKNRQLRRPEVLANQVRRMLKDGKSRALVENFAGQWLQFTNIDIVKPDVRTFPQFEDSLRHSMRRLDKKSSRRFSSSFTCPKKRFGCRALRVMSLGPHLFLAFLEGLSIASVLALSALGLSLVFGVMRVVNIAHGEFLMLGAVLGYYCSIIIRAPLWAYVVAMIVAPIVVGLVAYLADYLILRRIKYQPESTIVATIGLLYIFQQVVLTVFGPDPRPVEPPVYFRVAFPWFGYSGHKLVVVGISIILLLGTWFLMTRTKLGLYMRATQQNPEMAQAFGVPVKRLFATVFALGAMFAALAGVLVVPIQQAHYLMGLNPLIMSFIIVIIGGLGSLRGTLVAAILVGLGDGFVSVLFSPTLAKIVITILVALVIVIRPQGLFGDEKS